MSESIKNLPTLLEESAKRFEKKHALSFFRGISYTFGELNSLSYNVSEILYSIGVEKSDNIGLVGENSPHWVASYFGIQRTGAVVIPVLTDFTYEETNSVMKHAGATVLFISSRQLKKFQGKIPEYIKHVILLEDLALSPAESFSFSKDADPLDYKKQETDSSKTKEHNYPEVGPHDLAVIIYTSGTTGSSKGVMLSHENLYSNAIQTGSVHQVVESDVFVSILPLAHTYESTIGMLIPILNGASVYYIDKPPTATVLKPVLDEVRPTTMLTVPLIMEKIYRVRIRPGIDKSPITRLMSKFGPTRKIVHKAAAKKLKAYFGGRIRFFGIGGAPLASDVEKFLLEGGFPYAIGYGLTETSPMLAGFAPENAVYRSVGPAMEGVTIRIDNPDPVTGEGEIVATGKNIMKGYYKNEELTKEVFTEDGYFRTGDLGMFDKNGILFIKGRLKNMILGPNGENIYPEEIESVINTHEFVTESLVMESEGKIVAKVHLNFEALEEKFHHMIESGKDKQHELQQKGEEVLQEIKQKVNTQINKTSRLQSIKLQLDPFKKTATQKIKRFLYKEKEQD